MSCKPVTSDRAYMDKIDIINIGDTQVKSQISVIKHSQIQKNIAQFLISQTVEVLFGQVRKATVRCYKIEQL